MESIKRINPARSTPQAGLYVGMLLGFVGLTAVPQPAGAAARSLDEVQVIQLNIRRCSEPIVEALEDSDFTLTSPENRIPDAILIGEVSNHAPNRQNFVEKGMMEVSYWAVLRGANGRILYANSGRENSTDAENLCNDVAEEIVDRLSVEAGR